jgi:hypothetical protein
MPEAGIEAGRAEEILGVVHRFDELPNVDGLIRLLRA